MNRIQHSSIEPRTISGPVGRCYPDGLDWRLISSCLLHRRSVARGRFGDPPQPAMAPVASRPAWKPGSTRQASSHHSFCSEPRHSTHKKSPVRGRLAKGARDWHRRGSPRAGSPPVAACRLPAQVQTAGTSVATSAGSSSQRLVTRVVEGQP